MIKLHTHDQSYLDVLNTLKKEIMQARVRAHISVNQELIHLYWRIGKEILDRQNQLGWGTKVIEQLSFDLKHEFPEMKGFSSQNLWYMRQFVFEYKDNPILQQAVGEIPWGHNIKIMTKIKDSNARLWYIQKTIENGWSRNVLEMQIDSNLYERQGKAITNFKHTLPKETSDLAQQLFKSDYNFEFLGLASETHERHIERSLIDHIRDFLLELGTGFAFMGTQYKLVVNGDEFYIDMLFYHARLRCYVVIELKTGKFVPEYAGKLSFYLTAINRQLKLPEDNQTIGLILCQSANHIVVEYALSEKQQPMGVSKYRTLTPDLPKDLKESLPSPEQFKHFFDTIKEK
ncbi:MAG: PDDEXK nuclease domain-containing protein [Alphaproteobacteria bacterium]|nr:PDDEXK nuclease domain-containing protein [Alphaproteobacteria bacterium]